MKYILFLVLLLGMSLTSALVFDSHDQNSDSYTTSTEAQGIVWTPKYDGYIKNITVFNGVDAVTIVIKNSTTGADLASSSIVSRNASFDYAVKKGVSYDIVAYNAGNNYQIYKNSTVSGNFPYIRNAGNFTTSVYYNPTRSIVDTVILNIYMITTETGVEVYQFAPADNLITLSKTNSFSCQVNSTTAVPIYNLSLYFNNVINYTVRNTTAIQNLTFTRAETLINGIYNWSCKASSSLGEVSTAERKITVADLSINSVTYNSTTYETAIEGFVLNATVSSEITSALATLYYNGTAYSSTVNKNGNEIRVSNILDIPISTQDNINKTFFWQITTYNSTGSSITNTSVYNQTIYQIRLETCNATYTRTTLNFTAYDEINSTRLNPYNFYGNFNFWVGNGSVKKNQTFNNAGITEKSICIYPNFATFNVDADIEYSAGADYVSRNYYFDNAVINNVTNNISLYLLESDQSTSFILKVQDIELNPIASAVIFIQRYFPGTNEFKTVQMARTDVDGKSIGFYKAEVVDYKHIIVKDGEILLDDPQRKIFGEEVPYTLTFTIGTAFTYPWYIYQNMSNLIYTLNFNKTSKIVSYTFVDTSGLFTQGRLLVTKSNYSGSSPTICNTTSIQASATINCNLSSYDGGEFFASGYISRVTESLVYGTSFIITEVIATMGRNGLFMAMFIIITAGLVFLVNPLAGMWAVSVSLIFVNLMGFASFNRVFIFAMISITLIVTVIMGRNSGGGI